ncbi:MAG: hypothetical protein HRT41_14875 [Campylobacteraceae bacterium]|nr:hypothetical protein [Campylobacteraceae bacterium]
MNINIPAFKTYFLIIVSIFILSSCTTTVPNVFNKYSWSTDFQALTDELVEKSLKRIKKNVTRSEVVLVSDFVNLSKLENPSKLGFVLSESLKNTLSSQDIIIRQVEFGRDFTIGKYGFNMLSRNSTKILKNNISTASFALVGTYTVTSKKLLLFVKLIDIETGYILSSSSLTTRLTKEIHELERVPKQRVSYAPMVL